MDCTSSNNIICAGPIDCYSFTQPPTQTVPPLRVTSNFFYDEATNRTFYTYIVYCDCRTRNVTSVSFPVCSHFAKALISVEESIGSYGLFSPVDFTLEPLDESQAVTVNVDERLQTGIFGVYRLTFDGRVNNSQIGNGFSVCNDVSCAGFTELPIAANCGGPSPLVLSTQCFVTFVPFGLRILNYNIRIFNTVADTQDNIRFSSLISFQLTNIQLGAILTDNPNLSISTATPGIINIDGNIGSIDSGSFLPINIAVNIDSISAPGVYPFINNFTASTENGQQTAQCMTNVIVLSATGNTSFEENNTLFEQNLKIGVSSNDPDTTLNGVLRDTLIIPEDITILFTDFDGLKATYGEDNIQVPLNTPLSDTTITFTGPVNAIGMAGTEFTVKFTITSVTTSPNSTSTITNTLNELRLLSEDDEIFLNQENIPTTATLTLRSSLS